MDGQTNSCQRSKDGAIPAAWNMAEASTDKCSVNASPFPAVMGRYFPYGFGAMGLGEH